MRISFPRKARVASAVVGVLLIVAAIGWLFYQQRQLRESIADTDWAHTISETARDFDGVEPKVGSIQFLKSGYSITFDTAEYTTGGLRLAGELGNPKAVNVASLTLIIEAYRPAYLLLSA